MTYLALFDEIKEKTEQVCLLVSNGELELCPELLEHRQRMLEKLHDRLVKNKLLTDSSEIKSAYIALLDSLQQQDNSALSLLHVERKEMQQFFQKQPTIKKAINAYHKVQLIK